MDASSSTPTHNAPDPRVAVITDSAASLPACAHDLDITVVPMSVVVGDEVFDDGALSGPQVVARQRHHPVTTSAPSPGAYVDALERVGDRPAVITTVSGAMSASYDAAATALGYRHGPPSVVVDTASAAGGQGIVVLEAARAAASGASLDEVVTRARAVAAGVRLVALVGNLDHLARSGRVPGIAAWAGRSLGVRPLFEFSGGQVRRLRPARSTARAIERIVSACLADAPSFPARLHAAVLDATSDGAAQALGAALRRQAPGARAYAAPFSAVMVAHTGPGITGMAWWWEPEQPATAG